MERKKSAGLVIVGTIILLLFSGCINYEQETFLNSDMSGRISMHTFPSPKFAEAMEVIISKQNLEQMFKKDTSKDSNKESKKDTAVSSKKSKPTMKIKIKEEELLKVFNSEAIKNKKTKEVQKDNIKHTYITFDFDNIKELYTDKQRIKIDKDEKGLIIFKDYYDVNKSFFADMYKESMYRSCFEGCYVKYSLHMPNEIIKANTKEIHKNIATWKIPAEYFLENKNITFTATIKAQNRFQRWFNKTFTRPKVKEQFN